MLAGRSAVGRVGILGLAAGRLLERSFCCIVPRSPVSGGRGTARAGPVEEPGLTLSAVVSDGRGVESIRFGFDCSPVIVRSGGRGTVRDGAFEEVGLMPASEARGICISFAGDPG